MRTLAVVGGGVIGMSVAWRAAESGWAVTIFDPEPGAGASWVAGGMLAPLSEGWPGEEAALDFGAASLARWPEFGRRLRAATGISVFVADRTLTVASDAADAADLRTIAEFAGTHGYDLRLLDRAEVRAAEPDLARTVRAALFSPTESAVDNRLLVRALRRCCAHSGVDFRAESVASLDDLDQDRIVLAAGAASARLWPELPVRPVKGEILRLRHRAGATPPPRHVVRARVHGRPVYLVPRGDGIVVGATQYEAGFDTAVTVAGVRDLIADAEAILPAVGEYELAEASAGSRPGTPDNLPLIGRLGDRVVVATGHGRNGILGVPITVDAVAALLDGDTLAEAKAADPQRFSTGGKR
ncbi:glycine oxidase ThiO [Nocardia sp. CDC159]|uniref:glycine oxidase n=1 Tax=Nocardia pulmonis TaxID=2951408 RepID=A0A9X2EE45_9NOCA|nr:MULTISPECIES: glycine oxidase ThiO [Nocardia]MCM6777363.1 glycine oxidase ThiO [Nocardia pulmonis]MCM6790248.1 glycine oxidase ThiO [Nocardia sp. CDC159]